MTRIEGNPGSEMNIPAVNSKWRSSRRKENRNSGEQREGNKPSAGGPGPQQARLQTDIHIPLGRDQRSDPLRAGDVPRSAHWEALIDSSLGRDPAFYGEVMDGLLKRPKTLPCKYFYDGTGSRLFEQICALDEYYLTRTERGILERHVAEICALCGPNCLLVELGSGSSSKTRLLLDQLESPVAYMPVDIAREQLEEAADQLRLEYPELEILPVCADYQSLFELPAAANPVDRTVIFFPGSTIGNFEPDAAEQFLREIFLASQAGDALIVGVDLQKPREILEPAYNDAQGVTAAFNLNLLQRINRELRAGFDLPSFRHRAIYNAGCSRIEMRLVSLCSQTVPLNGSKISFSPGEFIVTEHSYKYSVAAFSRLAGRAGFQSARVWTDPKRWFGIWYLEKA